MNMASKVPLTKEEVIETLSGLKSELLYHHVATLFLFGSVARNEARVDSDLDFLVEFDCQIGLFQLISFQLYLEEVFHRKVDLVPRDSLREEFQEEVLREAIRAA